MVHGLPTTRETTNGRKFSSKMSREFLSITPISLPHAHTKNKPSHASLSCYPGSPAQVCGACTSPDKPSHTLHPYQPEPSKTFPTSSVSRELIPASDTRTTSVSCFYHILPKLVPPFSITRYSLPFSLIPFLAPTLLWSSHQTCHGLHDRSSVTPTEDGTDGNG